ncbi:MAG: DUF4390 domain-containing protein [Calditrichaeota bacterium]|nr:MAG: DUF4390 domain-containing protein [Calditrichota bacterium]
MIRRLLMLCLIFPCLGLTADRRVYFDSLTVDDGGIYLCYHIPDLLDDQSLEVLRRGVTSQVVHHIQLWQKKTLFSPLIKEYYYSQRIYFDNWEKKYRIITPDENRLTAQLETVREKCSKIENYWIISLSDLLENQDYYLSINVTFQPISAESYNALSDIFQENDHQSHDGKKSSNYLNILANLLGLGDKEFSLKTGEFRVLSNGTIDPP